MKKIVLIAAVAALSACSQSAEEAPAPEETVAAPEAPAAMTAAEAAGSYDVSYPDGTTGVTTIHADGTFVATDGSNVETRGTWAMKDGKSCFDPEGDAVEACWTQTEPDANGVFTATAPDGTVVTVTPQSTPAAADAMVAPTPAAT